MRPSILILDEATSMLDPEGRQELIQYIEDIRQQYGMTVLPIPFLSDSLHNLLIFNLP